MPLDARRMHPSNSHCNATYPSKPTQPNPPLVPARLPCCSPAQPALTCPAAGAHSRGCCSIEGQAKAKPAHMRAQGEAQERAVKPAWCSRRSAWGPNVPLASGPSGPSGLYGLTCKRWHCWGPPAAGRSGRSARHLLAFPPWPPAALQTHAMRSFLQSFLQQALGISQVSLSRDPLLCTRTATAIMQW